MTIAPIAGIPDLAPPKPDAGGGGDAFAPLIAQLMTPADASPDGKTVPPSGEIVPVIATPAASPPVLPSPSVVVPPDPIPEGAEPSARPRRAPAEIAGIPAPARFKPAPVAEPIILTPPVAAEGELATDDAVAPARGPGQPAAPPGTPPLTSTAGRLVEQPDRDAAVTIVPVRSPAPAVEIASVTPPLGASAPANIAAAPLPPIVAPRSPDAAADAAPQRKAMVLDRAISTAQPRLSRSQRPVADIPPAEARKKDLPARAAFELDRDVRPDILLPGAPIVPLPAEPTAADTATSNATPALALAHARPSSNPANPEPEPRSAASNHYPIVRNAEGRGPDIAPPVLDGGTAAQPRTDNRPMPLVPPPVTAPTTTPAIAPASFMPAPGGSNRPLAVAPPLAAPTVLVAADRPKLVEPRVEAPGVTPPATTPIPIAPTVAVAAILPARQAFGAALHRAWADDREPAKPATDPTAVIGVAAPAVTFSITPSNATLDTADPRWPHVMAQQIERLRDQADENSTRIRLLPDALGPVDVAVRRDGDTVHVQFTAREAETRQLLADAQPRLAEAAEARGLKLGRTDVSGGDASLADRQQQQRAPAQAVHPIRPTIEPRARGSMVGSTDTRIA